MTIRDAAEADLPAIVEIFNATIPTRLATAVLEPVTVEERRPWFHEHTADHHPLRVIELEGVIAGWLSLHAFLPRCAYRATAELSVYVHERSRRRGVARALLVDALARAPHLELDALLGLILSHNLASLRLFDQLGFTPWGLLPRVARLDGVACDIVIVGYNVPPN
ncbi:MAG: GNAT family N-acetyltransferase [Chthoniobacterales bacterium]